jgi:hypothetical protein
MESRGEIRPQFHHVIDVAPTVLEAAGLPEPVGVDGVQQMPLQGVGLVYSFDDPDAPDRHETQYFEMFANRGIYHKGWTAVTRHSIPWTMAVEMPPFDDEVWELYGPEDWNQAHDLSGEMPEKLHELQRLFLIEAVRYNVLPLDDRRVERFNADLAGRPQLIHGTSQLLFRGMGRLSENSVLVIKNKSHSVTAQIVVPDAGASGVIIAQVGEGRVEATVPMVFSGERHPGQRRLRRPRQPVLRSHWLGADRPGRGRRGCRPPDLPAGAAAARDGEAVAMIRHQREG